jgi:hypothetical protein
MPAPTSIFPQSSVQSIVLVEIGKIDGWMGARGVAMLSDFPPDRGCNLYIL